MTEALAVIEASVVPRMAMSTVEFAQQRKEFDEYVKSQLVKGVDFDDVAQTDKPVLLQPGADKLLKIYGLTTRMELLEKIEEWGERPFFMYRYRATVIYPRKMADGMIREEVLSQCEGSCNSRELKYAWRWVDHEELTPKQKEQAANGELKTKGGEKMLFSWKMTEDEKAMAAKENWRWENKTSAKSGNAYKVCYNPHGLTYRVFNDGVCDQVNTIQKMAQKRARVGAAIQGTNASDMFTQDLEPEGDKGTNASEKAQGEQKPEKTAQDGKEVAKTGPVTVDAEVIEDQNMQGQAGEPPKTDEIPFGKAPVDENAVAPEEQHILDLMTTATTAALVDKAWDLAMVNQKTLGPKAMKRLRDQRDASKDKLMEKATN